MLKHIEDPPILVYVKGDINCLLEYPTVAVIGTREPSKFGIKIGGAEWFFIW